MATTEINKTKILVKVHEPLIAIMQHKMEAACLKRDAYLDKALRVEAEYLRKEIATPNSDKAKNYIAAQLGDLKLKPLNLLLSTETVDLINEVCKEKNVPRDAFMNRFFLLLIASDKILTCLFYEFLHKYIPGWGWYGADYVDGYYGVGFQIRDYVCEYIYPESYDDIHNISLIDHMEQLEPFFGVFSTNDSILDGIEDMLTNYSSLTRIRKVLEHIKKYHGSHESAEYPNPIYFYPFEKDVLKGLPSEYDFLKVDNVLGFNTFMTDEKIEKQEASDAALNKKMSEKGNHDKLLAAILKEKQARTEKTKQSLVEKAKSAGEAK